MENKLTNSPETPIRSRAGQGQARFFPVHTTPGWLPPDMADALLAYAIENEASFAPAGILYEGVPTVDQSLRNAAKLNTLGPFESDLKARALAIKPHLERALGVPAFQPDWIEIELAAHGDGAHFSRHIDTFVVVNRERSPRVLTLILYLQTLPSGYTGGALRMFALGKPDSADIAPDHNLMVAFPAIAPHGVERVYCPSGRFADRRFAVNIWLHGPTVRYTEPRPLPTEEYRE